MRSPFIQCDVFKFNELKQQSCKDSAIVFVMEDRKFQSEDDVTPEVLADYEFYWDGQIYRYGDVEVIPQMKERKLFIEAIYNVLYSSPDQAIMNANGLLSWFEKEYGVKLDARIDYNRVPSFAKVEEKILSLK